jgi:hypothetical protein
MIDLLVYPFLDIVDPFPNTNSTYLLSCSINYSIVVSSPESVTLPSYRGYLEPNTSYSFQTRFFGGNRRWFTFLRPENMTNFSCVFSYTANYSVDMIYTRPTKTYAWATVRSLFTTEGIILVGVVLLASALIYASLKMMGESE